MEEIIKPVSKELLKAELTEDKRLRMTNKSNNQIYIITHQNAPNVMREIGRLREIAFRAAGGGTGLSMDIDEYDTMEHPYKQLIVWNPEAEEILGGYRYLLGTDVRFDEKGAPILATSHMFHFSDAFIKEYLPQTIELGRSFVTLEYQSTRAGSKGLFALDNLWDGLGALTVVMPNVKYFFGKVTMYPSYHRRGRDMILHFLKKHFYDQEKLVTPIEPLQLETSEEEFYLYERPWSMILGTPVKAWDNRLPFMMLPQHPNAYYAAMCLYNMNNEKEMKKHKIPKSVYGKETF